MEGLTVEEFLREQAAPLKLEWVAGRDAGEKRPILVSDVQHPALLFTGFRGATKPEPIQVVGGTEAAYLESLSPAARTAAWKALADANPCAVVLTGARPTPPEMERAFEGSSVPVLRTALATTKFVSAASAYFEEKLAESLSLHGTLVDVHGIGVLLTGPSGIGKSECALDLVDRGHRLVADDVVEIRRMAEGSLMGSPSPMIRDHMEIRGLGVVHVQNIFGVSATRYRKLVEFVVELEEWKEGKEYDRLGLEDRKRTILDVELPVITMPVRPGRPLAVIIEVAALNERLKRQGSHAARDLNQRVSEFLRHPKDE